VSRFLPNPPEGPPARRQFLTTVIPVAVFALVATFYLAQSARVRVHFPLDDAR